MTMLALKGNAETSPGVQGGKWTRAGILVTATNYSDAAVTAALITHRTEVFRYELHRLSAGVWSVVADITTSVKACHLKYDGLGEHFMGSATFEIVDVAHTINWITDAIRVYHLVLMPDGNYVKWIRGTFYIPSPETDLKPAAVKSVQTYDSLQLLFEDKITDWFKVPSPPPGGGFADGDAIKWARKLISDAFPAAGVDISPDSTLYVGDDPPPAPTRNRSKIYEVGTSRLDVVNSLLLFCAYEILRANPTGSFEAHPFVKPSLRPVDWSYIANTSSIIVRESGKSKQDLFNAYNQWLRVVSRPDAPLLRSRLTIVDPANPLSVPYRGRTVTDYQTIDAPDQATLDTVVQALYEDGQRVLKSLEIRAPIMPHGHQDKVIVQWTAAHPWYVDGNGVYIVYGWEFDCVPGAEMSLYLELSPFSPAVPAAAVEGASSISTSLAAPLGLSIGANSYGIGTEAASVSGTGAYIFPGAAVPTDSGVGTESATVTGTGTYSQSISVTDSGVGTEPQPIAAGTGVNYAINVTNTGAGTEARVVTQHA